MAAVAREKSADKDRARQRLFELIELLFEAAAERAAFWAMPSPSRITAASEAEAA